MTKHSEVSDRITTLRKERNLSISALAEEALIPEKTLNRRLKAPEQFKLAELSAVARALGKDFEELVA